MTVTPDADLQELSGRWYRALDAAQGAVTAGSGILPPAVVHQESVHLTAERAQIVCLLAAYARATRFVESRRVAA